MKWQPWNNEKELELFLFYKGELTKTFLEETIDFTDEDKVREEYHFHMISIFMYSSPFDTQERRSKYLGSQQWDGKHEGYMVDLDIENNKINQINLDVHGLGWGETEDLIQNKEKNKKEIEFVKTILKKANILK